MRVKSLRDKDLKNKCSNSRHSRSIIYGHTQHEFEDFSLAVGDAVASAKVLDILRGGA